MEYFVYANSFAAPFCSDSSTGFCEGDTPEAALAAYAEKYSHPAGLYAAAIYASADAYHKDEKPLARWVSNHARAIQRTMSDSPGSYCSHGPGSFTVNGEKHTITEPHAGSIVHD